MSIRIFKYTVGPMGTNCYLAVDETSREAALIDPGDEAERLKAAILSKDVRVTTVILTHAHFDHILALEELRDFTGAPLCLHRNEAAVLSDGWANLTDRFSDRPVVCRPAERLLEDGDRIGVGSSYFTVLHTPGHTPGSICLLNEEGTELISGDTLFRESIGRYDFPGGDYETLTASLKRIAALSDTVGDLRVLPGHGPSTRLSHELTYNPYLL